MVQPLRDPAYFARVFIEDGALTWPNRYDYDPIALHDEVKREGLLQSKRCRRVAAVPRGRARRSSLDQIDQAMPFLLPERAGRARAQLMSPP
jgi:hypothetical protein